MANGKTNVYHLKPGTGVVYFAGDTLKSYNKFMETLTEVRKRKNGKGHKVGHFEGHLKHVKELSYHVVPGPEEKKDGFWCVSGAVDNSVRGVVASASAKLLSRWGGYAGIAPPQQIDLYA